MLSDPCPAGWRIPVQEAFIGFDLKNEYNQLYFSWDANNKGNYSDKLGWWPACGQRFCNTMDVVYSLRQNGYYWTANPAGDSFNGEGIGLSSYAPYLGGEYYRHWGASLRCVLDD